MSRLLFIASVVAIVVKLLTNPPPGPRPGLLIDTPAFVSAGAPWFQVSLTNGSAPDVFLRHCNRTANVIVQHEIAGEWYTHRRPPPECIRTPGWAYLRGQRMRTQAAISVPGKYRLLLFYSTSKDGAPQRAYSGVITVVPARFGASQPSQLSAAPDAEPASPPSSR